MSRVALGEMAEPLVFKRRLDSIQYLRAIAAMLVVFVHLSIFVKGEFLEKIFKLGACGVDIFFVVCGFVSAYPMCWGSEIDPVKFLRTRLVKIVPAYWAVTIFIFAVGVLKGMPTSGGDLTFERLVKSLLFVPYQNDAGRFVPILYVGWSLNLEMAFYVFYAIILKIKGLTGIDVSIFLIASIALLGRIIDAGRYFDFYGSDLIVDFALGILTAKLISKYQFDGWIFKFPIFLSIFAIQFFLDGFTRTILVGTCVFMTLFFVVSLELKKGFPANRSILFAGNISYYIYLLHPLVIKFAEGIVKR